MGSRRCVGSISDILLFGLVFLAFGSLILFVAPSRTLTCAHSGPPLDACAALEPGAGDVEQMPPGCPRSPDMQCHLKARIIGLIPSHDRTVAGIREFELVEETATRDDPDRRGQSMETTDFTLLLVTQARAVDLGWHGRELATRRGHARLVALARNPYAEPVVLRDRRVVPSIIGLVLFGLGLMNIVNVARGRE